MIASKGKIARNGLAGLICASCEKFDVEGLFESAMSYSLFNLMYSENRMFKNIYLNRKRKEFNLKSKP
ncbi:MAG: hypothetical protein AAGM67_19845, partial [Bacteroidota bacterium]